MLENKFKTIIISKEQLGFAPLLVILIVVVLIIAGGVGYYFYTTSQKEKEVIAVVNGIEITKEELAQKLISLTGKPVLEQMINEIIIQQEAKKQKIEVKPEEIDEKIDEIKKRFPSEETFEQQLAQSGMTIEKLRQQFESQILMEKLVAKGTVVTEEEIRDYFYRNKARFAKPEEIKASHILLKTEIEAKVILSQIKAGADFAELARKESTDSITKDKGGDLGFFSRGKMTQAFEEAAFALEAGEISEVVKTPYGYHIIKVEERRSAQEPNLEIAREEIKETLTQQKIWTKKSTFIQDLREDAEIEIKLPELRD